MAEAVFDPVGTLGHQIFGLPVDRDVLFSNYKGNYKKRIEKRQRKLIVKISFLKPFLKKREQVLLVTTGYSPLNNPAQYLTGFAFVYLKRSLFVFTNYRVLHIPATPGYNYKNSIAQVLYAGCHSIELKGGTLFVHHERAGFRSTEKFRGIAVSERRKIRSLLQKRIPLSSKKGQMLARMHLCPRCAHELSAGMKKCTNCQLKFKNQFIAAISALIIPGGGYLYIRRYILGSLNALLEIGLAVLIYYLVFGVRGQMPLEPVHLALILIFIYIKVSAGIHSSHFTEEFIPTDKHVKPGKVTG